MPTDTERLQAINASAFAAIAELVAAMRAAETDCAELDKYAELGAARNAILEDALSVDTRGDWHAPGNTAAGKPTEYQILLSTGGPATRIIGTLNEWCEPETAVLEAQDWFLPWTAWNANSEEDDDVLLAYARQFWFGE